ncbi:4-alpha-glucanotransferase [Pengzhenrongella frigida]|uniref:4-alpha-glucanotransferase n=1 Tax=Pengzhenrongella frigida TaxID=1259133 RepID=A0A4Q5N3F6_9MICO|nr:4-alpha-glucanotransferase [Cellulomonas sp. HLT2-17]RYV52720.1 4-alpha-glucanotransferase [Cellulomonas sp. HLT2-17]
MTVSPPFAGRQFGILLHPSSLPGQDDIGTLGAQAYEFVDWLASTGASIWQILPLTLNGQYDSPYFSYSTFAGNPWLVDLALLRDAGLLPDPQLHAEVIDAHVPFADLPRTKRPQLLAAADAFLADPAHAWWPAFRQFRAEQAWLTDTAHFFALKAQYDDAPWWQWPAALRTREPGAVAASARTLAARIAEWEVLFYFADRQWSELKAYANAQGIRVLGDLPIYVNHDSADVWLHSEQFQLDAEGGLTAQSGVPPDYFSETGQLWGNPLYRWAEMAEDGFTWWVDRLRRCIELTDIVRIDHFRALAAYWEVPAGAADARGGRWVQGPGQAFLDRLREEFPSLPFVAEDLGTLDDDVHALRDDNGLFGMRILQFGFDGTPDNPHQPHAFPTSCIVYTGTHDNDTVAGWWAAMPPEQRVEVARYYQVDPGSDVGRVVWSLIEAAMGSRADVAILPIQDLLVLDDRARMNDPSTFVGNWSWRMPPTAESAELAESVRRLAQQYGRLQG